ncbi:unnamed protein product [Amoebophrya sp. A25]|nr:unnamed protein product [Amoebophrya sp. A25]|eukprot:GSA25T00005651001.1
MFIDFLQKPITYGVRVLRPAMFGISPDVYHHSPKSIVARGERNAMFVSADYMEAWNELHDMRDPEDPNHQVSFWLTDFLARATRVPILNALVMAGPMVAKDPVACRRNQQFRNARHNYGLLSGGPVMQLHYVSGGRGKWKVSSTEFAKKKSTSHQRSNMDNIAASYWHWEVPPRNTASASTRSRPAHVLTEPSDAHDLLPARERRNFSGSMLKRNSARELRERNLGSLQDESRQDELTASHFEPIPKQILGEHPKNHFDAYDVAYEKAQGEGTYAPRSEMCVARFSSMNLQDYATKEAFLVSRLAEHVAPTSAHDGRRNPASPRPGATGSQNEVDLTDKMSTLRLRGSHRRTASKESIGDTLDASASPRCAVVSVPSGAFSMGDRRNIRLCRITDGVEQACALERTFAGVETEDKDHHQENSQKISDQLQRDADGRNQDTDGDSDIAQLAPVPAWTADLDKNVAKNRIQSIVWAAIADVNDAWQLEMAQLNNNTSGHIHKISSLKDLDARATTGKEDKNRTEQHDDDNNPMSKKQLRIAKAKSKALLRPPAPILDRNLQSWTAKLTAKQVATALQRDVCDPIHFAIIERAVTQVEAVLEERCCVVRSFRPLRRNEELWEMEKPGPHDYISPADAGNPLFWWPRGAVEVVLVAEVPQECACVRPDRAAYEAAARVEHHRLESLTRALELANQHRKEKKEQEHDESGKKHSGNTAQKRDPSAIKALLTFSTSSSASSSSTTTATLGPPTTTTPFHEVPLAPDAPTEITSDHNDAEDERQSDLARLDDFDESGHDIRDQNLKPSKFPVGRYCDADGEPTQQGMNCKKLPWPPRVDFAEKITSAGLIPMHVWNHRMMYVHEIGKAVRNMNIDIHRILRTLRKKAKEVEEAAGNLYEEENMDRRHKKSSEDNATSMSSSSSSKNLGESKLEDDIESLAKETQQDREDMEEYSAAVDRLAEEARALQRTGDRVTGLRLVSNPQTWAQPFPGMFQRDHIQYQFAVLARAADEIEAIPESKSLWESTPKRMRLKERLWRLQQTAQSMTFFADSGIADKQERPRVFLRRDEYDSKPIEWLTPEVDARGSSRSAAGSRSGTRIREQKDKNVADEDHTQEKRALRQVVFFAEWNTRPDTFKKWRLRDGYEKSEKLSLATLVRDFPLRSTGNAFDDPNDLSSVAFPLLWHLGATLEEEQGREIGRSCFQMVVDLAGDIPTLLPNFDAFHNMLAAEYTRLKALHDHKKVGGVASFNNYGFDGEEREYSGGNENNTEETILTKRGASQVGLQGECPAADARDFRCLRNFLNAGPVGVLS